MSRLQHLIFMTVAAAFVMIHSSTAHASPCVNVGIKPNESPFCLELAANPASHRTGLQNRRDLPPRGGMLFVFPETAARFFWMQDTYIELDILFLDEQGRIGCLVSRVPPGPIQIGAPARYVVELAGGTVEKLDLWPGDLIALPPRLTPTP